MTDNEKPEIESFEEFSGMVYSFLKKDEALIIVKKSELLDLVNKAKQVANESDRLKKELQEKDELLYAYERTRSPVVETTIKEMKGAIKEVISFNRQHANDKYGDPNIAESWACVKSLRQVLK